MGICASSAPGGDTLSPNAVSQASQPQQQSGSAGQRPSSTQPKNPALANGGPPVEVKAREPETTEEFLQNIPVFSHFAPAEITRIAGSLEEFTFQDGQVIVREGDPGDRFYIIKEGNCYVTSRANPERYPLTTSDFFGEAALKEDKPRQATVTASGTVRLLSLTRENFKQLIEKTKVKFAKRGAVSAESANKNRTASTHVMSIDGGKIHPSDVESRQRIEKAIKANILFSNLDSQEQYDGIISSMFLVEVKFGEDIIRQGDPGDNFYVVESGKFEIFVKKNKDSPPVRVAERGQGMSFGELALMYNCPRAATVKAVTDAKLWALERRTFRRIIMNVSSEKLAENDSLIRKVKDFAALTKYERSKIAEALEEVHFTEGAHIIRQGDSGDAFYIIKKGRAVVKKDGEEILRYNEGSYFGERALLHNAPRAASVVALTPVHCLTLDRQAFTELLGPLQAILNRKIQAEDGRVELEPEEDSPLSQTESMIEEKSHTRTDIKFEDLIPVVTLGRGSFGRVQLVRHKPTGETFALKSVSKAQVVQLGQQEHIMSEKHIMSIVNHPFLIKLVATFKDRNCLYFLMEVSLGGELFSQLSARNFFDEPTARFYAGCVVLAFEYLQSKNIIYRDLKPENLLLDQDGYIKITDFGFAKIVKDRTWTLCGTPDYLAPEVVSGQGHGKGVDWWTLGILIFEMQAGYPPFYDEDPMKTYAKIINGKVQYPRHFSAEAQDLIARLLHPKPTKRLGVIKGGADMIKKHRWFKSFDWNGLLARQLPCPIPITIMGPEDNSNFDQYSEEDEFAPYDGDSEWDRDF